MAGQIIKRGERNWIVRIFLGRDATGKRKYVNKTIRGTQKDAQKYLNAALRDKDFGVFAEPAAMSLNEYLNKWLETAARPRLSKATSDNYEYLLKRHVRPALGAKKLCDIRPLDVQKLYSAMREKGLSSRTLRYTHAVLSSAFKQTTRWQMLSVNPCEAVELPRMERREMCAMTPEEVAHFLEAAKADRFYVLFVLALDTGMCPEEYLALRSRMLIYRPDVQLFGAHSSYAKAAAGILASRKHRAAVAPCL